MRSGTELHLKVKSNRKINQLGYICQATRLCTERVPTAPFRWLNTSIAPSRCKFETHRREEPALSYPRIQGNTTTTPLELKAESGPKK